MAMRGGTKDTTKPDFVELCAIVEQSKHELKRRLLLLL
jgi:hypothetical protein